MSKTQDKNKWVNKFGENQDVMFRLEFSGYLQIVLYVCVN